MFKSLIALILVAHGNTAVAQIVANQPPVITQGTRVDITSPSGLPGTVTLSATDPDAAPGTLVWSIRPRPGHGTASITAGSPSNSGDEVTVQYQSNAGYRGVDWFTVNVNDGKGGTAKILIYVSMTAGAPANKPPVVAQGASVALAVQSGTAGTVTLSATDADAAAGTLAWSVTSAPAKGTAGIVSGSPSSSGGKVTVQYQPTAGYSGSDAFTVTVNDGKGGTASIKVNVTVTTGTVTNQPPVITQGASTALSVQSGAAGTVSLIATDADAAAGTLAWSVASPPASGTAGIASGSPSSSGGNVTAKYQTTPGYSGSDAFTVSVNDGRGGTASIKVNITVTAPTATNQPPVIIQGSRVDIAVPYGSAKTVSLSAADPDAADGTLVWSIGPRPGHGTASVTGGSPSSSGGSVTVQYQPNAGYTGIDWFTVNVNDGKGGTASTLIYVSMTASVPPPNQSPLITQGASAILNVQSGVPGTLSLSATDPDAAAGTLAWSVTSAPAKGTASISSGSPSSSGGNVTVQYQPTAGYSGSDAFTVSVNDGKGGTASITVNVTVNASASGNPPPVITQGTSIAVIIQADTASIVTLGATDADAAAGTLAWSVTSAPAKGTASVGSGSPSSSGGNVTVQYQPTAGSSGSDTFTVSVNDGQGGAASIVVNVTVNAPAANQPPVITQGAGTNLTVQSGTAGTVTLSATDADAAAGTLAWSVTSPPAKGTAGIASGSPCSSGGNVAVQYQPAAGYSGSDAFIVSVNDGKGGIAGIAVNVAVMATTPAGNWYVDMNNPAASDTDADAGTAAKPFKTLQKAANVVRPGDTVLIRAGRYTSPTTNSYSGVFVLTTSGTPDQPITFRNYGTDEVIIDGQAKHRYAARLGDMSNPIRNVIIDGLRFTGALGNGLCIHLPDNVLVQNCTAYANNQNWIAYGRVSYDSGIVAIAGQHCTVQNCRVYYNGGGIGFPETGGLTPVGSKYCLIRDNFVYANSASGNFGNSSGVGMRFGEFSTFIGNIIYDNPDAAINGLGNIHNRFIANGCFNSWQEGGNQEGIKFCVRGGGANLVAFNLSAFNQATGFDATDGVGDVVINNTFYANTSWGLLLEGQVTALYNNLSYLNALGNYLGQRDIRPCFTNAMTANSDYNFLGDQTNLPTLTLFGAVQPHSLNGEAGLANPVNPFVRQTPRQIIHPEQIFQDTNGDGWVSIEEARAQLAANFALTAESKCRAAGLSLNDTQAAVTASIPEIIAAAQARIAKWTGDGSSQHQQGIVMYNRMIANLQAADRAGIDNLAGLTDFAGTPVSMDAPLHLGAMQN